MNTFAIIFEVISVALFGIVSFIGINANMVILIAILGDRKMRNSRTNMLLLNLAVADVLYLIAISVWGMISFYAARLNVNLCPYLSWIDSALLLASIETYTAISLERYIAIIHPMKVKHLCSKRNIFLAMALIWITALLLESPAIFQYQYLPTNNFQYMQSFWHSLDGMQNQSYCGNIYYGTDTMMWHRIAEALFTYFIPICISAVMYYKVFHVLWSVNPLFLRSRRAQPTSNSTSNATAEAMKAALNARRSVVKMLIICVIVFFVCYTPMLLLFVFVGILDWPVLYVELGLTLQTLVIFVSAFNPFLYTIFSNSFRERVREVVPRLFEWHENLTSTSEVTRRDTETTSA
ncbi:7 transmembrane receptor (rhodopsin family) domain-containing protein [Ditylenchus destructor]|uniref:7 transmembrane receptor (Rhodopsin family) domain-containing protein n=1 Tax=Ditylenchus destructor TaxID=166010 RepID=A0AAD4R1D6_9BILA|nr:7 transmembrane receptor (rhodopsin family) domain-containing protein [Ditylenchus destructor]